MLTRRQWLQSAGILASACAIDATWLEPAGLRISHHDLTSRQPPGRRARIVQISDLHLRAMDDHAERIAAAVNGSAADVAIITGDAVDDGKNIGLLDDFLARIDSSLGKIAVLGNWEYWAP